jgi:hypothetical protein
MGRNREKSAEIERSELFECFHQRNLLPALERSSVALVECLFSRPSPNPAFLSAPIHQSALSCPKSWPRLRPPAPLPPPRFRIKSARMASFLLSALRFDVSDHGADTSSLLMGTILREAPSTQVGAPSIVRCSIQATIGRPTLATRWLGQPSRSSVGLVRLKSVFARFSDIWVLPLTD